MPPASDFTDSTDWLTTPLHPLASLESSLRCQVCKDFFSTPMITSCSHTFCSLCIRRYLSQEGKCPLCREADQEVRLRRNWVVEEIVEGFCGGRGGMLEFARGYKAEEEGEGGRAAKRKKTGHVREVEMGERRSTRSQSKRLVEQRENPRRDIEVMDSDGGSEYDDQAEDENRTRSEPNDGLVSCPICSRRMKETSINSHLDSCIGGDDNNNHHIPSSPRRSNTPQLPAPSIPQPQTNTRSRLPTINYSMLNDNALRKKLRDLGISSIGSKETMRRRHTEWVNLWNANCDARNPVTKTELLRELNQWERTQGRQIDRGVTGGVMIKDFDREGWQQSNKGEFDGLIAQARAKRNAANVAVGSDSSVGVSAASPLAELGMGPMEDVTSSPLGPGTDASIAVLGSRDTTRQEPHPRNVPIGIMPNGEELMKASWGQLRADSHEHQSSSKGDWAGENVHKSTNGVRVQSADTGMLQSRDDDLISLVADRGQ